MMRMVVVDVGNTSTGIGLYENGRVSRVSHVKGGVAKEPERCAEALRKAARGKTLDGVVLGSVVPRVNAAWTRLWPQARVWRRTKEVFHHTSLWAD